MSNPPLQIHFIDNPHAPEVFASEACGFCVQGGNIVTTFASARVDHVSTPGPVNRVVIGRLVMPAGAAHALATELLNFLAQQGYMPPPPPNATVQ